MRKTFLTALIAAQAAITCYGQVTLGPLFSDNMVLQRNTDNAPIWGQARPGRIVKITTSWDGRTYVARAGADGKWKTSLRTPEAGGPWTITLSDGSRRKTVLENVMTGEVWLCSGQSNMQMPVEGWGKVKDWEKEKENAGRYGDIRFLSVSHVISGKPLEDLAVDGGSWQVCDSSSVAEFSATAYFFGRNLYERYNVPIGLVNSSWGGTIIEAWMSREAFEGVPAQEKNLEAVDNLPASKEERVELYNKQYAEWLSKTDEIIGRDDANTDVYTSASADLDGWKDYDMPFVGSADGTVNCVWWARRTVDIPASWAGRDLTIELGKVDDNDVTYFDGVMVGNTLGSTEYRTYTVPGGLVRGGSAVIAVRIHDTGGLSGIDCAEDKFRVRLSGTDESVPLTGIWKYTTAVNSSSLPPLPVNAAEDPNMHTLLYNAMINPIVPFAIRGVIWYQGENNISQAYQYRELMPMLVHDWRSKWNSDFPFLIVQLANYMHRVDHPQESAWAELREAQMMTRRDMAGVGMATTIDIGDADDIHPKNKQEVGRRLALIARDLAYGEKTVWEGPLYSGYKIEGDSIRVTFAGGTADGITAAGGGELKGFEIAGPDHVWHKAGAVVSGTDVLVSSGEVGFPVAVRYAWADNPECNLTNAASLPASPFRTDEWEGVSYGNIR